jgi:RNA 2',3'-cyclic 3'-phosphodiesterase
VTAETPALRLFVALDVPPAVRSELASFRAAAADPAVWRPIADEALHLTLAFLGWLRAPDPGVAEEVVTATADGVDGPRLALDGALLLPPRRPRVLAASVRDVEGELGALQGEVSARLADAGVYEPEDRPFRPHVTVARLRRGARAPRGDAAAEPAPLDFRGTAVTLYRSLPTRAGARYEPLVSVPLAG